MLQAIYAILCDIVLISRIGILQCCVFGKCKNWSIEKLLFFDNKTITSVDYLDECDLLQGSIIQTKEEEDNN